MGTSSQYSQPKQAAPEARVQIGANALANIGRGVLNAITGTGIGTAIATAITGTPAGETSSDDFPKNRADFYVSPSIQHIDQSHDGSKADIHIGAAKDPYVVRHAAAQVGPIHSPDAPIGELPDIPSQHVRYNYPDIPQGYGGYDEMAGQMGLAPPDAPIVGAPRYPGDTWHGSRGAAAAAPIAKVKLPDIPDSGRADRYMPLLGGHMLKISVSKGMDGTLLRVHSKAVPLSAVTAVRMGDSKYGVELVALVNRVITMTYGTVSELSDASQILSHNIYGIEDGVVKPAMLMEGGSQLEVYKGFLEGDYRVDAVGFAVDFGANQVGDWLTGQEGEGLGQIGRQMGDPLPYNVSTLVMAHAYRGNQKDVLSEYGIQPAQSWLRSADRRRVSRVQSLFPGSRKTYGVRRSASRVR